MRLAFFASLLAALALRAEPNFPLGTYVYTGCVLDWRNTAVGADAGLEIQAVSTNGSVLAACAVRDCGADGANFRLEVPVATRTCAAAAAIGDAPNCVIVAEGGRRFAAASALPIVASASAVTNCTVVYASATAYDMNGETVLVPDEYVEGIAPLLAPYGGVYDPGADWDGDGDSNYKEFVAGTNPFDASDRLRVTDFTISPGAHLLTFEYAGGHLYALQSTRSLSNPEWRSARFATSADAACENSTAVFEGEGEEDCGSATLYVEPAAESGQMFYRIEVKK